MAVKKQLNVKLFAGDQLVAESSDPRLWGQILNVITGGHENVVAPKSEVAKNMLVDESNNMTTIDTNTSIKAFAAKLEVKVEQIKGACNPTNKEPYLYLEPHYWEAFKKKNNTRGRGAIPPFLLAATLLALWCDTCKLDKTRVKCVNTILENLINDIDKNYARSLKKCRWLQFRNGKISINPAEISTAINVGKAYCTKQTVKTNSS